MWVQSALDAGVAVAEGGLVEPAAESREDLRRRGSRSAGRDERVAAGLAARRLDEAAAAAGSRIILATFGSEIPSARESSGIVTLPPSPARPTRSRHRSPYSSCDDSFIGGLRSHHSELQLRGVRHHLQAPRRIEEDLDVGVLDVRARSGACP